MLTHDMGFIHEHLPRCKYFALSFALSKISSDIKAEYKTVSGSRICLPF